MITFLNGILAEKQPTRITLDVGGVGYEVFIPLSSYDKLPRSGETCRMLTFDYVREDTHQLFGFVTEDERRMFLLLLGTNGVGPKLALSALSGLSVRDLKAAIVEEDIKRLSSISGLGRKTAERIVVDLRDKIGEAEALEATAGLERNTPEGLRIRDAVLALLALGYKQAAADKMVADVARRENADTWTVEEVIKQALGGESNAKR